MALYNKELLDSVAHKIKGVRFGMFTTIDGLGSLTSRPLTQQQLDDEGNLWFFTSDQSPFVRDLLSNSAVNVSFADVDDSLYVSITGRAELLRDRVKARELWDPMAKAWFPGGLDDPHLVLIKVKIQQAEYWDVHSSKMVQFLKMAAAAITGEPPRNMAEHHTIKVR
jgi:general stress protein 26